MYRPGHYGAALIAYAPVGAMVLLLGHPGLAVLGGGVALAVTPVPDYDQRVPLVEHRGITHTVAFALVVGAAVGGVAWTLAGPDGPLAAAGVDRPRLTAFFAGVGILSTVAHLAADVVTPAGVRPFRPVSDRRYSLGWVTADDPVANYALLVAGVLATAGAVWLATGGLGGSRPPWRSLRPRPSVSGRLL